MYKTGLRAIIFFVVAVSLASCGFFEKKAVVNAQDGLLMRDVPGRMGSKAGIIPHKTEITIHGLSDMTEEIDGIVAYWVKVEYKGKKGWVYGGYLELSPSLKKKIIVSTASAEDPVKKTICNFFEKPIAGSFYDKEKSKSLKNAVRKELGKPRDIAFQRTKYLSDIEDLLYTYKYKNLEVYVLQSSKNGSQFLLGFKITGTPDVKVNTFHYGMSREDVIKKIGQPFTKTEKGEFTYKPKCSQFNGEVTFSFKNAKVSEIVVAYDLL